MGNQDRKKIKIAIDAMGSDFAPISEVRGAVLAFNNKPDLDIEIVFVGDEVKINSALEEVEHKKLKYSIVNAAEIVTMDDDPTIAVKKKKNSSLYKALELHAEKSVDACLSAGNTGAVMSTATILLGRIEGVSRPTIGSFLPSQTKHMTFVLDVGANIECKPRFLYEFAVMGSIHVTNSMGLENPRIALLNIGEEKSKGTDVLQQTYELLKNSDLNFIGNIEGGDVLLGTADIVVCDGFLGNIVLKFAESVYSIIKYKLREFAKENLLNKIMLMLTKPAFTSIFKDFDYQEYGGVPLLGVNGVVIIGHGKSSPKAIQNMIYKAVDFIKKDVNKKIENALKPASGAKQNTQEQK